MESDNKPDTKYIKVKQADLRTVQPDFDQEEPGLERCPSVVVDFKRERQENSFFRYPLVLK